MLVHVVHALLQLGSWEAIRGMGVWVKSLRGQTPPWIVAAEAQAKSKYVRTVYILYVHIFAVYVCMYVCMKHSA